MAASAMAVPIPGICRFCGCSELAPCVAEWGVCGWADAEQTVCTFCAAQICVGELQSSAPKEPRVELFTEGECDRFLRERRPH